jgi:hypothetical protein
MSVSISIAYEIDQYVQILTMESVIINIYKNILININKIYQTSIYNIYLELLNEEEFVNIEECLNNPLRLVRSIDRYTNLNDYKQIWIYAHRTDISILKPLDDCNNKYKMMTTAGAINDTFEIVFECNSHDNCNSFINRLYNYLIDSVKWAPFKQYIIHNNNILRADDILIYINPPDCKIDYVILLDDSALPYDLDYVFPPLEWYMNPLINIEQIYNIIGNFILLII